MSIIEINKDNRYLISKFINNKLPSTFRYFDKRTLNILDNHILTIILIDNNNVVGYGHIDFDEKYWLGICIINEYQGKGYGKLIMNYLLNNDNVKKCELINLSVDKTNEIAIKLYQKYKFNIIKDCETYYLMNFIY